MSSSDLRGVLADALGDPRRVSDGDSERDLHASDITFHRPHRPDVVVYAISTEDVVAVLTLADDHRIPVTPFAAGSSLEGHVIPVEGGISLDLTRMDTILDVSPGDLTATVQPGVTRTVARARSRRSTASSSRSTRERTRRSAGWRRRTRPGRRRCATGRCARTCSRSRRCSPAAASSAPGAAPPKTSAGYDLLGLLVGSEGTLGVITELTLRLQGIPEQAVVLRLSFPDVEAACRAATAIVAAGAGVTRVELLDGWTITAINAHQGTDFPAGPSLFVEAAGSALTVTSDLELVTAIAESEGSLEVVAERDPTARTRLWAARHASAYAAAAAAPGKRHRSTDICVPLSELPGAVSFARQELERRGMVAGIVGHAGDGNVHLSLMVDPDDADEVRASDELIALLVEDALARGGTCTGEHGIGIGKIHALEREHGDLLPLMRGVKRVFDPNGIMNPGKMLPPG